MLVDRPPTELCEEAKCSDCEEKEAYSQYLIATRQWTVVGTVVSLFAAHRQWLVAMLRKRAVIYVPTTLLHTDIRCLVGMGQRR